jgi:modulator of FtsH protease HflK
MRRTWIVRGVLGLLFVAWLLTGITEVRPGERAVVRRFGRVLDVQPRAGLWIGLPWGIDVVDRISVEQERRVAVGYRPEEGFDEQTPPGQLLSGDHNLVNVQVVVYYSVDPDAVVDYVEQRDRVEELITRATEALLAEWVAGRTVDDVLQQGSVLLPLAMQEELPRRLAGYRLGVRVRRVNVAQPLPPTEVKQAFDSVAEAKAEGDKLIEQAHQYAANRRNETEAEVRKLESDTEKAVAGKTKNARAEAFAFEERLRAYRENPLVREAGRWEYLVRVITRLARNGQLQPLDPAIEPRLPGQK